GRSERPSDRSLWTLERHVEELATVVDSLGLERFHLFGSSWGGMLAMEYLVDRNPPGVASLVLAGSPASVPLFVEQARELVEALPAEVVEAIVTHEQSGWTSCPEYHAALLVFYRRHLCRLEPWPASLERSFAGMGHEVYETMCGPSEFTVVGNLRE